MVGEVPCKYIFSFILWGSFSVTAQIRWDNMRGGETLKPHCCVRGDITAGQLEAFCKVPISYDLKLGALWDLLIGSGCYFELCKCLVLEKGKSYNDQSAIQNSFLRHWYSVGVWRLVVAEWLDRTDCCGTFHHWVPTALLRYKPHLPIYTWSISLMDISTCNCGTPLSVTGNEV